MRNKLQQLSDPLDPRSSVSVVSPRKLVRCSAPAPTVCQPLGPRDRGHTGWVVVMGRITASMAAGVVRRAHEDLWEESRLHAWESVAQRVLRFCGDDVTGMDRGRLTDAVHIYTESCPRQVAAAWRASCAGLPSYILCMLPESSKLEYVCNS